MADSGQRCCGCLTLAGGSRLAGGYSLVLSLLGIIAGIIIMKGAQDAANTGFDSNQDAVDQAVQMVMIIYGITTAIYAVWFLGAVMLLVGVSRRNRCLLLTYIIITAIVTGICVLGVINFLRSAAVTFSTPTGIFTFILSLAIVLLNFYALWCVSAHRKELDETPTTVTIPELPPNYTGPQYAGPQYPGPQYAGSQYPAPQYAEQPAGSLPYKNQY